MLTVSSELLQGWVVSLLWPLTRMLAFVASAPILSHRALPRPVKLGFALLLTLVVMPTLPPLPALSVFSAPGLLVLVQQILLGLAMGFALRIIFVAIEMAGQLIGMSMGLGFAVFFDPQTQGQSSAIGQFLVLLAILVFFSIDGHLVMIATLAESFHSFPISAAPQPFAVNARELALWGGQIFGAGLLIALPVVAALLVTNLALGILSRSAPQLNLFGIGFPVTLTIGFVVLALTLDGMLQPITRLMQDSLDFMQRMALPLAAG